MINILAKIAATIAMLIFVHDDHDYEGHSR